MSGGRAAPFSPARLVGLLMLGLAARIAFVLLAGRDFDVTAPGDHLGYTAFARLMLAGPEWITTPLAAREPLYAAFMALAYAMPWGDFGSLQGLQVVIGACTAPFLYAGLRACAGERNALLTGVAVALHPHFVPMAAEPLRENLIVPLIAAFLVTFVRVVRTPGRQALFMHALVIALLVHTDVRFLPLTAVFPVMAWLAHREALRAMRETAWVAGFLLVLMIPYQVRGYVAMGHPVVVTDRFFGRWLPRVGTIGEVDPRNRPTRAAWLAAWEARKQRAMEMDSLTVAEQRLFTSGARPTIDRAGVYSFLFQEYWRFAQPRPLYRPYPDGRFAPAWSRAHDLASSLVVIPFLVCLPLLFWLARRRERRLIVPFLAYLAAHSLMHVVVHARERYRIPLEVIMALAMVMTLTLLWDRLRGHRRPTGPP